MQVTRPWLAVQKARSPGSASLRGGLLLCTCRTHLVSNIPACATNSLSKINRLALAGFDQSHVQCSAKQPATDSLRPATAGPTDASAAMNAQPQVTPDRDSRAAVAVRVCVQMPQALSRLNQVDLPAHEAAPPSSLPHPSRLLLHQEPDKWRISRIQHRSEQQGQRQPLSR